MMRGTRGTEVLAHERGGFEFGTLIGMGFGRPGADGPSRRRV